MLAGVSAHILAGILASEDNKGATDNSGSIPTGTLFTLEDGSYIELENGSYLESTPES